MEDLVLVGSGGCMREILWQIWEHPQQCEKWNVIGYVDKQNAEGNPDCYVGGRCCQYLGDDTWLLERKEKTNVAICVGDSHLRKKIADVLSANKLLYFPVLILGNAEVCSDVQIGQGCIISINCAVSTNVKLGKFVFVNIGATICHDDVIGDFVTLSPGVKIAGAVTIDSMSDIGIGATVIQGIHIGQNVRIGAGGVVIRDIGDNCTAVGVPARVNNSKTERG